MHRLSGRYKPYLIASDIIEYYRIESVKNVKVNFQDVVILYCQL